MHSTRTKRAKCISRQDLRPQLDTTLKMKLLLPEVKPEFRPTFLLVQEPVSGKATEGWQK